MPSGKQDESYLSMGEDKIHHGHFLHDIKDGVIGRP